jgi:hypothetical protein
MGITFKQLVLFFVNSSVQSVKFDTRISIFALDKMIDFTL